MAQGEEDEVLGQNWDSGKREQREGRHNFGFSWIRRMGGSSREAEGASQETEEKERRQVGATEVGMEGVLVIPEM